MTTEIMQGVTMKAEVTVNVGGRKWQIFSPETMVDCGGISLEEATREHFLCVDALNKAASRALSCGDASDAWHIWDATASEWGAWGAEDSEPRHLFEDMMIKVYGRDSV